MKNTPIYFNRGKNTVLWEHGEKNNTLANAFCEWPNIDNNVKVDLENEKRPCNHRSGEKAG